MPGHRRVNRHRGEPPGLDQVRALGCATRCACIRVRHSVCVTQCASHRVRHSGCITQGCFTMTWLVIVPYGFRAVTALGATQPDSGAQSTRAGNRRSQAVFALRHRVYLGAHVSKQRDVHGGDLIRAWYLRGSGVTAWQHRPLAWSSQQRAHSRVGSFAQSTGNISTLALPQDASQPWWPRLHAGVV